MAECQDHTAIWLKTNLQTLPMKKDPSLTCDLIKVLPVDCTADIQGRRTHAASENNSSVHLNTAHRRYTHHRVCKDSDFWESAVGSSPQSYCRTPELLRIMWGRRYFRPWPQNSAALTGWATLGAHLKVKHTAAKNSTPGNRNNERGIILNVIKFLLVSKGCTTLLREVITHLTVSAEFHGMWFHPMKSISLFKQLHNISNISYLDKCTQWAEEQEEGPDPLDSKTLYQKSRHLPDHSRIF